MPSIKNPARLHPLSRPLTLDNLRAFDAVARQLSFSAAAALLNLTQSATSRRIQALEDELGAPLFVRDTRKVALTSVGEALLSAVQPSLERIDRSVVGIRQRQARRHVSVSTFASMATLWLLPRLEVFQVRHPDIDLRIHASDALVSDDDPEIDLALRLAGPAGTAGVPAHALHLFDEVVTPLASPHWLAARTRRAPLTVADLGAETLIENEVEKPSDQWATWAAWLHHQPNKHPNTSVGERSLQPKRWIRANFTHQVIQTAAAGHGLAMGRLPMVADQVQRGNLVEPFGAAARVAAPYAYWLVPMLGATLRPELRALMSWLQDEARLTREALSDAPSAPQAAASRHPQRGVAPMRAAPPGVGPTRTAPRGRVRRRP
jgi:LysR family transcriptional regulator, glycine cleavage system transcriptional activator